MFVERLEVHHAPGMPRGLSLKRLDPGLVLLVGPNASGKSTTGRVLRGMLWPGGLGGEHRANATWRLAPGGAVVGASLQYGRCDWEDRSLMPREELGAAWNLSLRDLLRVDSSSDHSIARAIQTELDGGYDLRELDSGGGAVRPHWSLRKPYNQASQALRGLLQQMDELAEAEAALPALKERASEAAGAPDRLTAVRNARKRRELLVSIGARRAALQDMPDRLERLPEGISQTATDRVGQVRSWSKQVEERRDQVKTLAAALGELAFPVRQPTGAELQEWAQWADRLVRHEEELGRLERDRDRAAGRCKELAAQVWQDPHEEALPGREGLERLQEALDDLASARAALDGATEQDATGASAMSEEERAALVEGRQRLWDWLSQPRELQVAVAPQRRTWLAIALAVLGVLLVLVGIAIALVPVAGVVVVAMGALLIGVAVGLFIGSAAPAPPASPSMAALTDIAYKYANTGQPPPESWTSEAVGARVKELDRRLREDDQTRQRAADEARLRQRRARLQATLEDKQGVLEQVVASFGLDPELGALSLTAQANRILELADARADLGSARTVAAEASKRLRQSLDELVAALGALKVADLLPRQTPEATRAAVQALTERDRQVQNTDERLEVARRELKHSEEQLGGARRQLDEHLRACGLEEDELDQLPELERQRGEFKRLVDALAADERRLDELEREIPAELKAAEIDLDAEEARLTALKDELEETAHRVAEIQQDIHERTEGRSVQQALARKEQAQDALAEHRDAQQLAVARHALVGWLRTHRATADAPALLERAKRWFLTFTRNRYVLEVDPDGGFRARDTQTQQRQGLKELSDGTRIQLLLAARLSFIEHTEDGGSPVPLFLDEALSTTDPERFAMVGRAVLELARSGRQVFYATSSPDEVAAWKALAAAEGFGAPQVRRLGVDSAEADWDPAPALPTVRAAVPDPAGLDPVAYTVALGGPRPELHTDVGIWPLPLVLHDDLDAAAAAARAGVWNVAQLDLADHGVPLPMEDGIVASARARAKAIGAALDGLRVGRGKTVSWTDVDHSGAVSGTFAERVQDLLAHHRTDPAAFVAAVAELPRFRSDKVEQLERHLADIGVLDPRQTLPAEAVVERAQRACREAIRDGHLTLVEIEGLVRFVAEVVGVHS